MEAQSKWATCALPFWRTGRNPNADFALCNSQAPPRRESCAALLGGPGAQPRTGSSYCTILEDGRNPDGEFVLCHFGQTGAQPKRGVCILPFGRKRGVVLPSTFLETHWCNPDGTLVRSFSFGNQGATQTGSLHFATLGKSRVPFLHFTNFENSKSQSGNI